MASSQANASLWLTVSMLLAVLVEACTGAGIEVVRVIDGDTIVIQGNETIRYSCIDTPERGEPGFHEATQRNRELLASGTVTVQRRGKDKYGRTLAHIYADGRSVERALLAEALARPWRSKYCDAWVSQGES